MPRGGGIALLVGVLVTLLVLQAHVRPSLLLAVFLPATGAAAIGLTDDLVGDVSVRLRLVALLVVASAGAVAEVSVAHPTALSPLLVPAIFLWVVSFTNFFNFMDGINGIAASEAILTGVTIGFIARHLHRPTIEIASFALAAACLGFLPFNFPKARVFSGDIGSYFLGASLALLVSLAVLRGFPLEAVLAPVTLFAADAGVTLARRIVGRRSWTSAHREHTYQRLVDTGWSQTRTTLVTAIHIAGCSALGSVSLMGNTAARGCADLGILLILLSYFSLPAVSRSLIPVSRQTDTTD